MGLLRTRERAKDVTLAINTDYSEALPKGLYRSVALKLSGIVAASGAGTNALDGAFNFLGRVDLTLGGDTLVSMHGTDLRHLCAFLQGAQNEILPASIANPSTLLAQCELQFDKLMPGAGINAKNTDLLVKGRFRGLTNIGTTVTSITSGKLRISGETDVLANDDVFEPRFSVATIDMSATNSDLNTSKEIKEDVEIAPAIMLRMFDRDLELSDPNTSRIVKIEVKRKNGQNQELAKYTWGELKAMSTARYGIASSSGQIATGVALITLDDPSTPWGSPRLVKGDSIIVRVDNSATIEDEFTATTPASGDLCYVNFLHYVPKGVGVDLAKSGR